MTIKGFEVHFKDHECLIIRNEEIIVRASEKFGLYKIDLLQQACTLSEVKGTAECIHVWHNRLGHRDPKAIQLLAKAQASKFRIKPGDKLKTCDCCIKAKITQKLLPKKSESRPADTYTQMYVDQCRQ